VAEEKREKNRKRTVAGKALDELCPVGGVYTNNISV
jgi:hypothetical protein